MLNAEARARSHSPERGHHSRNSRERPRTAGHEDAAEKSKEFAIDLRGAPDGPLGIEVEASRGATQLRVVAISDGLVHEWNKQARSGEPKLCCGDRIISVHGGSGGKSGDAKAMVKLLASGIAPILVVRRDASAKGEWKRRFIRVDEERLLVMASSKGPLIDEILLVESGKPIKVFQDQHRNHLVLTRGSFELRCRLDLENSEMSIEAWVAAIEDAIRDASETRDCFDVPDLPDEMKTSFDKRRKTRRSAVAASCSAPLEKIADLQAWEPQFFEKSKSEFKQLSECVRNNLLFQHVGKKDLQRLVGAFWRESAPPGTRVIRQGDVGDRVYIVAQGNFDVLKKEKKDGPEKCVKKCVPGDLFGELALLYNAPRAASVVSLGGQLWVLDRDTFQHSVQSGAARQRALRESFLSNLPLLQDMGKVEFAQLADALRVREYSDRDVVIREGDLGQDFYIVEEGECRAYKDGKCVAKYGRGGYFGELALLGNRPRAATVIATSPSAKLLALDRHAFHLLIGDRFDEKLRRRIVNGNKSSH